MKKLVFCGNLKELYERVDYDFNAEKDAVYETIDEIKEHDRECMDYKNLGLNFICRDTF